MRLFLHIYSRALKNIKKAIPNKVMFIFEAWKLSTMNYMLPKFIETRLTTNMTHLVNGK
jgi:hypothetical protein